MPVTTHKAQLSRQAWPQPQLPRHYSQPSRSPTLLAAMSEPVANTDAVRAEFVKAGIPDEVTTKVLKQYQSYLSWGPNTKLRSALQLWLKQLGSQQLSARLDKHPGLLLHTPQESNDVYLWLVSIGVDAERVQQNLPRFMARQLNEVQRTVQAIQQGLQLTDEQLPAFFRRHIPSLLYSPEHVAQTLQAVADLLAVPMASKEMQGFYKVCGQRPFHEDPAVLMQRVALFCEEFGGGQGAAKAALKQSIFCISPRTMRENAAELKKILGWTDSDLNKAVCCLPRILTQKPSTVASNMQKLLAYSFSSTQALDIYTSTPSLTGYDWDSPANVENFRFLTLVVQLSRAELAARPSLLSTSLAHKIGPCSEFLYRCKAIPPDTLLGLTKCSSYVQTFADASFAARFKRLSASPPLLYDEDFKQHWQQRWTFLTHEMGLSIADIFACRPVLFTSLPNTLAPRWHFLTLLEAAQADFKAADHLKDLATLSDEHFAQAFSVVDVGLVYNSKYMQHVQGVLSKLRGVVDVALD